MFKIAIDADALSTLRSGIMEACGTADFLNKILVRAFVELGAPEAPLTRTILIKDRYFVGYRYYCCGMQAVLLADTREIKFYDQAGELLKKLRLEETEKKIAA